MKTGFMDIKQILLRHNKTNFREAIILFRENISQKQNFFMGDSLQFDCPDCKSNNFILSLYTNLAILINDSRHIFYYIKVLFIVRFNKFSSNRILLKKLIKVANYKRLKIIRFYLINLFIIFIL